MRSPGAVKDSDRDRGVMHGDPTGNGRNTSYIRRFGVVTFLHAVLLGNRARSGLGLPEVVVAVTVLGVGILGVAALGGAASKLRHIAAVRSAQTVAGATLLEGVSAVGPADLEATVDTTQVFQGLIELRVTVSGAGPAGPLSLVARRPSEGP